MTEQLTFQKIQGNGSAVQLDKGAPAALTGIVNGMCDELFSCAGLPLDEDSRVCGRNLLHLLKNRFQGSTIADDPLERTLGVIGPRVHDCCIIFHRNLYT